MVSSVKTISFSRYKKTISYKQDLAVISLFLTFFSFDIAYVYFQVGIFWKPHGKQEALVWSEIM